MRKRPLSVTLSPYNYELLLEIASQNDRSLSYMIEWAIQRFASNEDSSTSLPRDLLKKINKKYGMEPDEDEKASRTR